MRLQSRGFTLIEMLIVISIIIIMATLTIPVLNKFGRGAAVAGATRTLQSGLNEARGQAVMANRDHKVFFFLTGDARANPHYGMKIYRDDGTGTFLPVKTVFLPEGMVIDCVDSDIAIFVGAPPDDPVADGVDMNEGLTFRGDGQVFFGVGTDVPPARNGAGFSLYDTSQNFRLVTGQIAADIVVYGVAPNYGYLELNGLTGKTQIAVVGFAALPADADFNPPAAGTARPKTMNPNRVVTHGDTQAEEQQIATDGSTKTLPIFEH